MKKFYLILLLCSLLAGCAKTEEVPETEEVPDPAETVAEAAESVLPAADPVVYVSLGDSIARGCSLGDPENEAYSAILADSYEADGGMVAYNFGVDGQDSSELISYITENPDIAPSLEKAQYVSISIGANNFLGDAFTFLSIYNDFKTNSSTVYTSEDVTAAFQQFNTDAADGLEQLREDLPKILDKIRASSENSEILFLTCYNPYGAVHVTLDWGGVIPLSFSALADSYVTQMNDIIRELSDEYDYTVADVYAAFDGRADRYVFASPVESGETFSADQIDPHPNQRGHSVIADVILDIIQPETEE